jgi:Lar family restriction alleviation protein
MEELKLCPLCGSHARVTQWDNDSMASPTYYQVICFACDAKAKTSTDKSEAIAAWNKRV